MIADVNIDKSHINLRIAHPKPVNSFTVTTIVRQRMLWTSASKAFKESDKHCTQARSRLPDNCAS